MTADPPPFCNCQEHQPVSSMSTYVQASPSLPLRAFCARANQSKAAQGMSQYHVCSGLHIIMPVRQPLLLSD